MEKKVTKAYIEYDDGSSQTLTGDAAERWNDLIRGMSMTHIFHGGDIERFPWVHEDKP